jgi:hypothetical protein
MPISAPSSIDKNMIFIAFTSFIIQRSQSKAYCGKQDVNAKISMLLCKGLHNREISKGRQAPCYYYD